MLSLIFPTIKDSFGGLNPHTMLSLGKIYPYRVESVNMIAYKNIKRKTNAWYSFNMLVFYHKLPLLRLGFELTL